MTTKWRVIMRDGSFLMQNGDLEPIAESGEDHIHIVDDAIHSVQYLGTAEQGREYVRRLLAAEGAIIAARGKRTEYELRDALSTAQRVQEALTSA
jgi:hypothetical protein